MDEFRKTTPSGAITPLEDQPQSCPCSCFICDCPSPDSMVCMGIKAMAIKDIKAEMDAGTPFGLKLREIAKLVEALP